MKVDKEFPGRVRNISEKDFCNLYFLKVDISFIMYNPYLKRYICIQNIAVKETVSQNLYIVPGSFSTTFI